MKTVTKTKVVTTTKKITKPKLDEIYLATVVDRSGSMGNCVTSTISAFNEYFEDIKKQDGKTTAWVSLFDTEYTSLCSGVDIKDVPELTNDNYRVGGLTALYDAIGKTISSIQNTIKKNKFKGSVVFVVQTDGQENSSREYTREKITSLIKNLEDKDNWTFIYLGADQDAFIGAGSAGVSAGNTLAYGKQDTRLTMKRLSGGVFALRDSGLAKTKSFVTDYISGDNSGAAPDPSAVHSS